MYGSYFKRAVDIVLALLSIVLAGWICVLILILYIVTLRFPVFFFQDRIGRDNRVFRLIKFRSLQEGDLPLGQRRFWLGDFLRFLSLDELPQIWNVCRGEMSFIGPRPLPIAYLSLMSPTQKIRHQVLPGITGWAQVNGRHALSWSKKFELDIYYVNHLSVGLDFLILFKTIVVLLSLRKDNSLQEEKFKGN
jgi:lipopolysaccharide/colanic/teichoic acid biosynthesis glycosyltransferase